MRKIWLSGFTCLQCGVGHYGDGYDVLKNKTLPCTECGHQPPPQITQAKFLKMVEKRDKRKTREAKIRKAPAP